MPEMSQHVSIVFKELFEELKSMKQQQWTITNYTLLLLIAAFTLKSRLNQYVVTTVVVSVAVIAILLLLRIQWHMGRARLRIDGLHKAYFTDKELEEIGMTEKERANLGGNRSQFDQSIRGWEFLIVLIAVLLGGLWIGLLPPVFFVG